MGRWSLSYYMVHQPVMIGILMLAGWLLPHMG
jgi:peptidoglycan/LPS O-acetylase OafA/YrhL